MLGFFQLYGRGNMVWNFLISEKLRLSHVENENMKVSPFLRTSQGSEEPRIHQGSGARFNCIKKHHEKDHENHHEKTSHQKVTIKKSNWTFAMIFVMIFFQLNWAPDQGKEIMKLKERKVLKSAQQERW